MAYRRSSRRSGYSTRGYRSSGYRRTRRPTRRRSSRRAPSRAAARVVIQVVGAPGGVAASPVSLGFKARVPVRSRY